MVDGWWLMTDGCDLLVGGDISLFFGDGRLVIAKGVLEAFWGVLRRLQLQCKRSLHLTSFSYVFLHMYESLVSNSDTAHKVLMFCSRPNCFIVTTNSKKLPRSRIFTYKSTPYSICHCTSLLAKAVGNITLCPAFSFKQFTSIASSTGWTPCK